MPPYRKKPFKKRPLRRRRKKANTNKLYRNPIPRTLQIATRRNKSQVLRFVVNHTYRIQPGGTGTTPLQENVYLRYLANSIYNVIESDGSQNAPGSFVSQSSANYPSGIVNAEGFDQWQNRYFHSQVLGSKMQATLEPISSSTNTAAASKVIAPSTFYINLSGSPQIITPTTNIDQIMKLPYTRRAGVICTTTTTDQSGARNSKAGSSGSRLYMTYSTAKFQGINKMALGADQTLKGQMAANPTTPTEKSYFTIGIRPSIPGGTDLSPTSLLRVKIEYIVRLTEPTSTNYVQAPGFFNNVFG